MCMNTCVWSFIHSFVYSSINPYTIRFIHSFIRSLTHSFLPSFVHSVQCLFISFLFTSCHTMSCHVILSCFVLFHLTYVHSCISEHSCMHCALLRVCCFVCVGVANYCLRVSLPFVLFICVCVVHARMRLFVSFARRPRTLSQNPYSVCPSRLEGFRNLWFWPQCAWLLKVVELLI